MNFIGVSPALLAFNQAKTRRDAWWAPSSPAVALQVEMNHPGGKLSSSLSSSFRVVHVKVEGCQAAAQGHVQNNNNLAVITSLQDTNKPFNSIPLYFAKCQVS